MTTSAGTVTFTFTWKPDAGKDLTSDPPPKLVVVKKSATASYRSTVTWFGVGSGTPSGSADNGLGTPVDTTGSSSSTYGGVAAEVAAGIKTETNVDSSSGTITRSITLTATASGIVVGGYDGVTASVSADVALYTPHAHPVNFRQISGVANSDGSLYFEYAWESSSGDLNDLVTCEQCEVVTYLVGSGCTISASSTGSWKNGVPYYDFFPPEPFNPIARNKQKTVTPLFQQDPWNLAIQGWAPDHHHPWQMFTGPYQIKTVIFTAVQVYAFHCDICMGATLTDQKNYEIMYGALNITRTASVDVHQHGTVTTTKSGLTGTFFFP